VFAVTDVLRIYSTIYNAVLHCFPSDRYFLTMPLEENEWERAKAGGASAVNSPIPSLSCPCKAADKQMQEQSWDPANTAKVPKLNGVSAMGRYHTYEVADPFPLRGRDTHRIDTVPTTERDSNMVETPGYDRFLAMVNGIQTMVDDWVHCELGEEYVFTCVPR